jgi:molecular chaperone DnaK
VRKSEVFFTIADEQRQVDVKIYQGESQDALENIKIGEFRIDGLSKAPAGNPVILDLALDRDGILHVAAREKVSSLEAHISIDQAVPRYGKTDMQDAQARIGVLFGATEEAVSQPTNAAPTDTALAALLSKAQAKLDEAGEEDRNEMVDLIEAIRDAAADNDTAALDEARRQLTDLLFYLET